MDEGDSVFVGRVSKDRLDVAVRPTGAPDAQGIRRLVHRLGELAR